MTIMDETMGPLLIGVITGAVLYGMSCSQVYYYYNRYKQDPVHTKLLVAAVWISDTTHQALVSHSVYWYLVTGFGNPVMANTLVRSILVEVLVQAITGFLVQSFYTVRVYKVTQGNLWLTIPVALLVVGELAASIAYTAQALGYETFPELIGVRGLSYSMNVLAAAGDLAIAAVLCTTLQMSKTGFRRSDTVLNKLIIFSVNTGLLTSICACLSLITILALPNTFIYICFFFLIGRLYANSLMATLNSRKGQPGSGTSQDVSVSLRDMGTSSGPQLSNYNTARKDIAIRIETTHDLKGDRSVPKFEVQKSHTMV